MAIDDPLLPAAVHLTGPFAGDVLRPAVEHAGGALGDYRCSRVHYRSGNDLIAQFRADVTWPGGVVRRETLVAATTKAGPPAGTVPVVAETDGGLELTVGVWRWPFDPALPGLEFAVRHTAELLAERGAIDGSEARSVTAEIVRYRPLERVVLRLRTPTRVAYMKFVRPDASSALADRHRLMTAHGLPVPEVLAADAEQGWLLIAELAGPTLRDLVKHDELVWPAPADITDLIADIAAVDTDAPRAFRRRLVDGPHHAALLTEVMPSERERLTRISEQLTAAAERCRNRPRAFVHGDLYESQIIVADGQISGLLDIDEAGLGDPVDDIAVFAAHLRHRALTAANGARIDDYVDAVVAGAAAGHDPADVAAATAAVLTGLATAPFRAQRRNWERSVSQVLELTERQLQR